jgi:pSer/pThr/pTyr-binding forkhead associated (FHA) protein
LRKVDNSGKMKVVIEDHSSNGTYVNGKQVSKLSKFLGGTNSDRNLRV